MNNAGRQQFNESIRTLSTEDFDATFKTNVYAMFWITKAALEYLPAGSSIINTSSVQAYEPSAILLDYAQTKAAIAAFTKRWRSSWAARQCCSTRTVLDSAAVCGGQPQEKIESLVPARHWGVRVSRLKSRRCT